MDSQGHVHVSDRRASQSEKLQAALEVDEHMLSASDHPRVRHDAVVNKEADTAAPDATSATQSQEQKANKKYTVNVGLSTAPHPWKHHGAKNNKHSSEEDSAGCTGWTVDESCDYSGADQVSGLEGAASDTQAQSSIFEFVRNALLVAMVVVVVMMIYLGQRTQGLAMG